LRRALLVLSLTCLTALGVCVTGRVPFSSDQAVVGLMARDILEKGLHPVFYQGSEYAGTLEPHYLALVFAAFPQTVVTHRLALGLLLLATVALVFAYSRAAFGERAGLGAGLYLALGPFFFYYKALTSDGSYLPMLLLGALILGLLVRRARSSERSQLWEEAALALVAGLAWWVQPLTIVFVVPILLVLASAPLRGTLSVPRGLAMGGLFLLGSAPWWLRNLQTGWASLRLPVTEVATLRRVASQFVALVRDGLPIILGARATWQRGPHPGLAALSIVLALIAAGHAVWWLTKRRGEYAERLHLAMFLSLAAAVFAAAVTNAKTDFLEPRYAYASYLALAPLFGHLVATVPTPWRIPLCLALVMVHASGYSLAPRVEDHELGVESRTGPLVTVLKARGVDAVYASYWEAYRVSFVSRGAVIGTPYGTWNATRRPEDQAAVARSPSPAFLLEEQDAIAFQGYVQAWGKPYRQETVEGLTLFSGLDPDLVSSVRLCLCIPPALRSDCVEWLGVEGPAKLAQGTRGTFRLRLRNRSLERWPDTLVVGYHWRRANGENAEQTGLRARFEKPPKPGESATLEATVEANVPPGSYTLVFDLVQELVTWLEARGVAPLLYPVQVTGPPVS